MACRWRVDGAADAREGVGRIVGHGSTAAEVCSSSLKMFLLSATVGHISVGSCAAHKRSAVHNDGALYGRAQR